MAYFRKLDSQMTRLLELFSREDRWLIIINADPDALASAMALKRIMAHRVLDVGIAQVNEITRPDNLEMISSLRIRTRRLTPTVAAQYDKFALVDSQPHHHEGFAPFKFSIVIDHHPLSPEHPLDADYTDIKPDYGAVSSLFTEYLYNLRIRPGKFLATALLYGIRTDTSSFERIFCMADVRAFQFLNKYANHPLLRKIYRSEFHLEWLEYFSQAFYKMRILGQGLFAYMNKVESPDILVALADFFLRVQGVSWTAVCGQVDEHVVAVFRGDGLRKDMGRFASRIFKNVGSAGGHKSMARAEIPLENMNGESPETFIWNRLHKKKKPVLPKEERPLSEEMDSLPDLDEKNE